MTESNAAVPNDPFLAYLVCPNFIYGTEGGFVDGNGGEHQACNQQTFIIPGNLVYDHVDKVFYDVDPVGDPGNPHVVDFVDNYSIEYIGLNRVTAALCTNGPRFNFHVGIWVRHADPGAATRPRIAKPK